LKWRYRKEPIYPAQAMHPLSIQIITRDNARQKEVQQQYIVQARHPRWEMLKIFWHAFWSIKFK
jgi:hypothetical protein